MMGRTSISTPNRQSLRQVLLGLVVIILLIAAISLAVIGLSRVFSNALGGAMIAGCIAVAVAFASKSFERQKDREAAIGEKKREIYRKLLAPWEKILAENKVGKNNENLLAGADIALIYASAFDAVLYGSVSVVQKYGDFRAPNPTRDGIDTMLSLAALLVAMREDVTGKKSGLSLEIALRTFMNLSDEELAVIRLREYVATHPEAQKKLGEVLRGGVQEREASKQEE